MDHTKRSRACEHELQRLLRMLESIPIPGVSSKDGQAAVELAHDDALIIFEDECEPRLDVASLAISLLPPAAKLRKDEGAGEEEDISMVEACIGTLASLCVEGEELMDEATQHILPPLLLYGEDEGRKSDASTSALPECAPLRSISSFLPFLLDVSLFLGRASQVARSLLQQIHAFHSLSQTDVAAASERSLYRCWRTLGDLLAVLLQADEVIRARPQLREHWSAYMKSMETTRHNPAQFGTTDEALRPLLIALQRIEAHVISATCFRNCYEQSFGALDEDAKFVDRFRDVVLDAYDKWDRAAASDVPDKRRLTAIVALTTFYQLHFSPKERKLLKTVWASQKKIVVFHLLGDLLWSPCQFLLREVPVTKEVADKKTIEFVQNSTRTLYEQQGDALIEEAYTSVFQAKEWAAGFRLDMWDRRTRDAAECLKVADVILKGARLADTMSRLLKTILNSASGEVSMSQAALLKVCAVVQAIKLISKTFADYWSSVVEVCQMAGQQWRCHIISAVDKGRAALREDAAKGDKQALHSIQALDVAASVMLSSACRARVVVAAVALDVASHKKLRGLPEWPQLPSLLTRLETLCRPRRLVARVSNCSFLLFHRHLFGLYFDSLLKERPPVEDITLMMLAATDCAHLAMKARRGMKKEKEEGKSGADKGTTGEDEALMRAFMEEVMHSLREQFLAPLCGEIENDLRVLSHKHLKVDDRDKTPATRFEFFCRVLKAPALRIYYRVVSIREFVEDYLARTFYNLTAVSPHDAHTYAKMAMIAEFRYGLQLVDGHLPHAILNQGLDVVHVMRTLNAFAAAYNYDLYHNLFVEKRSASRSLSVLSWEHMANSLRTHGMGVVNTSVNLAYQLLRKKLSIVSQFLDDEHVKALLTSEVKHFEENRKQLRKMYPVTRAERLNRAMCELGSADDEETYFDRFRVTITQLGNSLGFVRAMKAAADAVIGDALVYDRAEQQWIDEEVSKDDPTVMLRRLMRENRAQDARNRQYIEKLVTFFRDSFSPSSTAATTRFAHLQSIAILAPALTVNYVTHMLQCRERSRRRAPIAPMGGGSSAAPPSAGSADAKELTYVDDGFVLGMAYLLTVVDCWEGFSALNWFRSVLERVEKERRRLDEAGRVADAAKTNNLKLLQLEAYEKEFKLLSYSLQSARMFFAVDGEEGADEKADDDNDDQ